MARFDRFNLLIYGGVLACTLILVLLMVTAQEQKGSAATLDKALREQISYQARIDFLHKLYQPVEQLRASGKTSAALLKLDELARHYPQEDYGEILRGEILYERGAIEPAIAHYVRAVRLNGDYVDKASGITRRSAIQKLVKKELPKFVTKARKDPHSQSLQKTLRGLYYLKSRLAGGCE